MSTRVHTHKSVRNIVGGHQLAQESENVLVTAKMITVCLLRAQYSQAFLFLAVLYGDLVLPPYVEKKDNTIDKK